MDQFPTHFARRMDSQNFTFGVRVKKCVDCIAKGCEFPGCPGTEASRNVTLVTCFRIVTIISLRIHGSASARLLGVSMLTVIFGAGASYDSNPSRQPGKASVAAEAYRPPLANELFGDRELFSAAIARFERIHPIIPRLRHLEGGTVEGELQRIQAEASADPERNCQLAAVRYYLQEMLWDCETQWRMEAKGISNYKSLLDRIRHRRHADEEIYLATFNYDT